MAKNRILHPIFILLMACSGTLLTACTPRVDVVVPDKPITINLNVKIDHEIRIKVDKQLDALISEDSGIF